MKQINCCFCEEIFYCASSYMVHINKHPKLCHDVVYECTFEQCHHKFNKKFCFKRHVFKHFENKEDNSFDNNIEFNITNATETIETEIEDVSGDNFSSNHQSDPIVSNATSVSYKNKVEEIHHSAMEFLIQLNSISNFTRSDADTIRNLVEQLVLNPVLEFVEDCFLKNNFNNKTFSAVVGDAKGVFSNVKTDYMLEKTMKKCDLMGSINEFNIGNSSKSKGTVMPLEFQFQKLFEKNKYIDEVLEHIKTTENQPSLTNFVQGELWQKKKSLYPNKTVIPFFLYADDFGINNSIGSKANRHSMCNFYYSFPCLPKKSSKQDEVYLACTIKASDIKRFGNDCFITLANTLKKLEVEGIEIETKDGSKQVHFIMGLFLGDNLGLNVILGFSKSFSAHYYCRFCLMKKSECQKSCIQNSSILRNRINYREAHERQLAIQTGISSECCFHVIPTFHCTENFTVDVMHDFFEGICHNILCDALSYYIKEMQYFSIQTLNERLEQFSYGKHDKGNEKQSINIKEIESRKLKMSAKQMISFCHYFTILFGHFIPHGDQIWQFLLDFFELIDDILCFEITNRLMIQITSKITKLNQTYQILFKKNLTPKFHFLTHYELIIKNCGPLRNLWSFKYEGKHKQFKIYSHVTTSRKNIPISFSYKQQMAFANFLLKNQTNDDIILRKLQHDKIIKNLISKHLKIAPNSFSIYLEGNIWGYSYSTQHFVATFIKDFEIYSIALIIRTTTNKIFLCCKKITTTFNNHYAAFECGLIETKYKILNLTDIVGPPVELLKTTQEKTFIKLKEFYTSIY